jgi:hypothetical protein
MEFGDVHGWIFGSLACDVSIKVDYEIDAGSETFVFIHANPEHVLAEGSDKDRNIERHADCSSHTNIGKATFLQ